MRGLHPPPLHGEHRHMQAEFTLLYDSECPFCRREVAWLQRRSAGDRLAAIDIAAPEFDAGRFGLTLADVQARLHGITTDGRIVTGMAAIRAAWRAVGLGWVMAPTGWPLFRPLADLGYRVFARYRVRLGRWLGRRCQDRCPVR
ncbi:MAG: DUF393 domain-containing protein [Planctomycetes bacterium]|nr:DUF393 domain-containing protein [Planctomycetota bacterium]